MSLWLVALLVCLATHRLTRLAVEDKIPLVAWPRERAIRWLDPTPEQKAADLSLHGHWGGLGRSLAYLLECPWCMSAWTGGVVVLVTANIVAGVAGWLWLLLWLAAGTVTGFLSGVIEAEHEQRWKLREAQIRKAEIEAVEAEARAARR